MHHGLPLWVYVHVGTALTASSHAQKGREEHGFHVLIPTSLSAMSVNAALLYFLRHYMMDLSIGIGCQAP